MGYYDRFKKLTAEQERERDLLIFGEHDPEKYMGGIRHYENLDPEVMDILIQKGYANPDESQNDCPDISECLDFCKRHEGFKLHGYVVSRERNDCRVSVEGVEANGGDVVNQGPEYVDTIIDFVQMFRHADDFQIGGENSAWYCWFD